MSTFRERRGKRKVQTASAVLCYSRMQFFQCYPTFQRFDCKVFLIEALRYFSGAPARVMIDNALRGKPCPRSVHQDSTHNLG